MTQAIGPTHPRKLYSALCECKDSRARAAYALEFMRNSTGAPSGFLLLAKAGELLVAASTQDQAAPAELMEQAKSMWAKESEQQAEGDKTRTVDVSKVAAMVALEPTRSWKLAGGDYEPRLMGIYRDSHWVPIGIAVLAVRQGSSLSPIRRAYIDALCNAFIDAGDVVKS